jgi:hypothetical protein
MMLMYDNITYENHVLYDAIFEYHKYLVLIFRSDNNFKSLSNKLSPSSVIDTIWHSHILDTESYVMTCKLVTGLNVYLHHYIENSFLANQLGQKSRLECTKEWYKMLFGNIPEGLEWIWE